MADFVITDFLPEHFDAVMEIENSTFGKTAWTAEMMRTELAFIGESRQYWVALADAQVIGYCGIYYNAPEADVQTIAVAAGRQGNGIGTALFETMLNRALELECTRMMLEVEPQNERAIALYERYGFKKLLMRANYYGPGLPCVVMECEDIAEVLHG